LVTTTYHTGVKLTQAAMMALKAHLQRAPSLGKWFVDIIPATITG
jgi:hypothetical protein